MGHRLRLTTAASDTSSRPRMCPTIGSRSFARVLGTMGGADSQPAGETSDLLGRSRMSGHFVRRLLERMLHSFGEKKGSRRGPPLPRVRLRRRGGAGGLGFAGTVACRPMRECRSWSRYTVVSRLTGGPSCSEGPHTPCSRRARVPRRGSPPIATTRPGTSSPTLPERTCWPGCVGPWRSNGMLGR
jgi:hypothetical protein